MNKIFLITIALSLTAVGCANKTIPITTAPPAIRDLKNTTYLIDNEKVTLINGQAKITTDKNSVENFQYFGNEALGDFNNDGSQDTAFLLTKTTEGTGVFYYLAAALKTAGSVQGTNGILIGDRIAPQTTEFSNGEIIVNYADRKPGEPMTASPSIGVSRYFKVSGNTLEEVPNPNSK